MAVEPPPALVDALRTVERPPRPGLRWTTEDQWHVTLQFLGTVDPSALVAALSHLIWGGAVMAEAGPAPTALSRHVWMVPVLGLSGLAGAVAAATATAGLAQPEERPFVGHLTLARARHPKALGGLPAPPLAFRWEVEEVLAFRSELLPGGARHQVIGRFPVGER